MHQANASAKTVARQYVQAKTTHIFFLFSFISNQSDAGNFLEAS
jgi:hypothetical protein